LLLVGGLFAAVSLMADSVETVAFTPLAFPSIPGFIAVGNTVPTGINDGGQIAGQFQSLNCCGVGPSTPVGSVGFVESNGSYYGFYATPGQSECNIYCGNQGDTPSVFPTGINDSGAIVGNYPADMFLDTNGFVVAENLCCNIAPVNLSSIAYPGLPIGNGSTYISGVNDSGEMIGVISTFVAYSYTGLSDPYPWEIGGFLYANGNFTDLPFTPLAINNLGQIVGENGSGQIVVDTNGNIQILGAFPFLPTGFNDAGTIVGGDYIYAHGAFTQIQLDNQTGASVQINAVNDGGEFVGTYTNGNGEFGFSATPEPGALGVLLAGLCGIAMQRRRMRVRGSSISG
jgi:hypothetical protein